MISLDYRDKRPIYEQITEKLEKLIVCGALESHAKMPSVRSLAIELSVNPNTIQRAYAQLEQDGYLYTVMGRGNFVSPDTAWKKGRTEAVLRELTEVLTKAYEAKVPKGDLQALLDRIYSKKEEDRV